MKKEILLLFLFVQCTSGFLAAQSQGPHDPNTAIYSAFGCLACPGSEWQNLTHITHLDFQYVDVALAPYPMCFQTSCYYSRTLFAFDYGFSIPSGATILGVTAEITRKAGVAVGVSDSLVSLYTGSAVGTNHASTMYWPVNTSPTTYGDSLDTWGWMLTPDTVNSMQFGLALIVMNKGLNTTITPASVDNINMTIFYSTSTGIASQTKSARMFSLQYHKESSVLSLQFWGMTGYGTAKVIDIVGHEIYSGQTTIVSNERMEIELPKLKQGIYFAIVTDNGKYLARKFVVE